MLPLYYVFKGEVQTHDGGEVASANWESHTEDDRTSSKLFEDIDDAQEFANAQLATMGYMDCLTVVEGNCHTGFLFDVQRKRLESRYYESGYQIASMRF